MWMLLFLYSVYFTVISAHEPCPDACKCRAETIKCAGLKLPQIPKWIPKDVTNLDLSGNKLTSFENNTLLEFTNLTELNLTDNEITDVASLGDFPKSLKILYLKGNKLTSLNGNWRQFIKLDFSENTIGIIGNEDFKGIKDLTELKLDGNNLTEFPEIQCDSLKTLDLSNNKLRAIKGYTLNKMIPSIEFLKLSNNQITTLGPAAFSKLKLKHLYLDGNFLETVSSNWMFGMASLEYLHLENNKIMNISSSSWKTYCCTKLKYINLAHNNLKQIVFGNGNNYGGNFMNLKSLKTLNLASNKIFYISNHAFQDLGNLRVLDMRKNPVVEIKKDAFSALERLSHLRMSSGVLYCDCKLRWFSKWLRKKGFSSSVGFRCNKPDKLRGSDFTKIRNQDLVCDSSRPEIISHPKSQDVLTGSEVKLSCAVRNGSIKGLQIFWQKNNIDINEPTVTILTQVQEKSVVYQSILILSNVTDAKDSGVYQCFVGKERIPSLIASLRVFVLPRFTSIPGDLVTAIGEDVRFNCSASGLPQPRIIIRVPNPDDVKTRFSLKGNTFIIRNISQSDVGLYRCLATSAAGVINTTFTLNIIGKPVAEHDMLDKVVLINDSTVFVCAASAWPRPHYTWFKDGKQLDLASSNLQLVKKQNAQHLIVLHVRYSDAGSYKCRVSNPNGSIELSSYLKVVKDFPEKPVSPDGESLSDKTLIGAVIFTAACTMVLTSLICVAVLHALTRRGCKCFTRPKTLGTTTIDSFATADPEQEAYVEMTEAFNDESPRSSSTFVTSSGSRTHSDIQSSSSESGSTKEHRESSYDGPHSSGVCSMNSSNSSLSSTVNHRNTFPFSNAKTYLYQETGKDDVSKDVSCKHGHPTPRQSIHHKSNEQYCPGRRKHRSSSRDKHSRSRERHVNKRRKCLEQERLQKPLEQTSATDEYRTESVTESEGTVA